MLSEVINKIQSVFQHQEMQKTLGWIHTLPEKAELDVLIDEILLASRLEANAASTGATSHATESVDLLALAAEEAAKAGATLDWQGSAPQASSEAILRGDARLLRRLMRNLLENAQRHGGSDVRLTLKADASAILMEVTDAGPGVPESEREAIFEPFFRSSQASEQHGGVGLGLSLVRSIARQHGGSAQCMARADGEAGARFIVCLPKTPTVQRLVG